MYSHLPYQIEEVPSRLKRGIWLRPIERFCRKVLKWIIIVGMIFILAWAVNKIAYGKMVSEPQLVHNCIQEVKARNQGLPRPVFDVGACVDSPMTLKVIQY